LNGVIRYSVGIDRYDGILIVDVPISEVDVPDPAHLRRSLRYPGAMDLEPEAAIEAARDPDALIARDPRSRTGEAIRVVGYSPLARRVLVIVLLPHEHPPGGRLHVATASPASQSLRDAYAKDEEELE